MEKVVQTAFGGDSKGDLFWTHKLKWSSKKNFETFAREQERSSCELHLILRKSKANAMRLLKNY